MEDAELVGMSRSKARVLLQLPIPLVTWYVVNVTAEVNDFRLISLDTNRVSREEVCLPSFELSVDILDDLLWRGYLRAVKLSLGVNLPYIVLIVLHSFVGSVQRLHKLSPLFSFASG